MEKKDPEKKHIPSQKTINKNIDFMNAQYNRLAEDWRHFNNLMWQLPTVAITICSAIIGVVYTVLKDSDWYSKVALLIIGALFLSMILIELLKLRLFHNMRTAHLLYIDKKMKKEDGNIQPIQTTTKPKEIYYFKDDENPIIIENEDIKRVLYINPHETTTGTIYPPPKTWMKKVKLWFLIRGLWFYRISAFKFQAIAMILVIIGIIILAIVEVLNRT